MQQQLYLQQHYLYLQHYLYSSSNIINCITLHPQLPMTLNLLMALTFWEGGLGYLNVLLLIDTEIAHVASFCHARA